MAYRYEVTERVQFSETDMAGIVHFSNFFRYMERAEHSFWRSLGLSVTDRSVSADERIGWPRVHASCDYKAPLHFEEEFKVEMLIEEIRSKVIRYLFRFRRIDGVLVAEGRVTAACVRKDPASGQMKAVSIPERILEKVSIAPAELLAQCE